MPTRPPLSPSGQQPPRWRRALAVLGLALAAASFAAPAQAAICYVAPDGVATNSGADWANAKELQAALSNAHSANCTDIRLKQGTYTSASGYRFTRPLVMQGGYTGADASARSGDASLTVLTSTGTDGPVLDINNISPNSQSAALGRDTAVKNLTIAGGNNQAALSFNGDGGGLRCISRGGKCNLTLRDLIIRDNTAKGAGGGIHLEGVGWNNTFTGEVSPLIENVSFFNNTASGSYPYSNTQGHALFLKISSGSAFKPVLNNVTVVSSPSAWGAAINTDMSFTGPSAHLEINNATFKGGGTAIALRGKHQGTTSSATISLVTATVRNSIIEGSLATGRTPALSFPNGNTSSAHTGEFTLENTFLQGTATTFTCPLKQTATSTSRHVGGGVYKFDFVDASPWGSCTGTNTAGNALLGLLQNNGGAVPTLLPAANSPVVNQINTPCTLTTDARGVARPQGNKCDYGAAERSNSGSGNNPVASVNLNVNVMTLNGAGGSVNGQSNTFTTQYESGGTATLTAVPNASSRFTSWGGDCAAAGTNPVCTLTMSQARTVTATFDLVTYAITPTVTGDSAGGNVDNCATSAAQGSTYTCTPTVNAGYTVSFTGCTSATATTCTIANVQSDRAIGVNFTRKSYAVGIATLPQNTNGQAGICTGNGPGDGSIWHGETATCTATPSAGYTAKFVTSTNNPALPCANGDSAATNSCTLSNITSARTIYVGFLVKTYQVTSSANPAAGGSITCPATASHGSSPTCTITTSTGYTLTGVSGGCVPNPAQTQCTASNVQGPLTLVAQFSAQTYALSTSVTGLEGNQLATIKNNGSAVGAPVGNGQPVTGTLTHGDSYNLTAEAPHHACTPSGTASGTVNGSVTVAFTCTPEKYDLKGTITGMTGSVDLKLGSIVVQTSNSSFTFPGGLTYNQPYDLTVQTQPADQTCTVSANGKGDHATGNVTDVVVTCVDLGTQAIACNAPSKTWGDADFDFPTPGITTDPVGQTPGAVSFSLPLTTPPPSVANACELVADDPADPQPPKLRIASAGICKYDVKAAATSALKEATQACEVTVDKKTLVLSINGSAPMLTGDDLLLSATFDPAAPTGASVTWASGNQGICTVDASGRVTALAQGTCSITAAWAGDDNHAAISASASISVSLPSRALSGTVTGLVGGQTASVSNNGGVAQTVANGGSFSFTATQGDGYSIAASAPHHTCQPASGTVGTADVTGISMACTPVQYSVGGTVTGLPAGTTATVSLGGATPQTTNSAFNFASSVAYHSPYSVSATATGYTCTPATGTVTGDVTNAQIACTAIQYSLAYTVSGLGSGNTVVLSLGGVDKPVAANGSGSYADALTHGQPYALTVKTQPTGQTCTVASGSGTASADVSGVAVVCDNTTYPLTGAAQPAIGGSLVCTPTSVAHGTNAQCTATANAGWRFQAFDAASACTRTSGTGGATCEIDDVQAARTVTAQFEPWFTGTTQPASGAGGPGTATFTGGGDTCSFDAASTAFVPAPASLPQGKALPQGLFQFKLVGCTEGSTVTMHVTWPQPLGSDYLKHGFATPADKDSNTRSYFAPDGLMVNGHTATFTVTDGAKGDDDWAQDGTITDPSGGAQPAGGGTDPGGNPGSAHPVPTLGAWGALLLPALIGLLGLRRFKAKSAASA